MAGLTSGSIKLIAALFAGGSVAAIGAGYAVKDDSGQPVIQSLLSAPTTPKPESAPKAEGSEEVAALPPKTENGQATDDQPVIEQPQLPGFDILRVERDGSVVIAGKAPANSEVEIIENGTAIASGKAGPAGDFAIVFDSPLAPGAHELIIRATPVDETGKKGEPVLSAEAGIVTVPQKDDANGEVLAMVQKPGEATRILQQPEPAVASNAAEKPEEVAALETQNATEPATPAVKPEPAPKVEVMVKAVDVEDNKVFIAGKGEPGKEVRIYINDTYRGSAKVNPFGNYLLELDESLDAGKYDLRVDMLGDDSGDVESRVAVVIDHKSEETIPEALQVAKAEPVEVKTPEPVEVKTPEPVEVVKTPEPEAGEAAAVKMETEITKPAMTAAAEPEPQQTETPAAESTEPEKVAATAQPEQPVKATEAKDEPAVIKTGRSVIIRRGDSLWKISRRMLGQGRKYTTIFSANANKIEDPDRIYPGQVFDIPDEEEPQQAEQQG